MQKYYFYDNNPSLKIWDEMWKTRKIEDELISCNLETPPNILFQYYLSKENRILDAGCGLGKWVIFLHQKGYNIVGIDNNELVISILKDYNNSLQVEFGDILNLNYLNNSFDAYISMGVIEHFEDGPMPALKEAYRILKPGGLIFVSVPTVNIIRKIIRRPFRNLIGAFFHKNKLKAHLSAINAIIPHTRVNYYHFFEYRYTPSELENFLKGANFKVIKTVPHDFYGSKNHAVGLIVDFSFLGTDNEPNFKLNSYGKIISNVLNKISPWIACSSVLCVAKSLKHINNEAS